MILAQYTIRSKQDYIFRTNRILEIVGASEIIADTWDLLFKTAEEIQLNFQRNDAEFRFDDVRRAFEAGELNLVELFCGGGNETILFDSEILPITEDGKNKGLPEDSSFVRLNKAFSYKLIKKYPGLIPMVVYVEATGDYHEDIRNLQIEAEKKKNRMEPQWSMFTVPFAMMDRTTFQPFSHTIMIGNSPMRMSHESYEKYLVGRKLSKSNKDVKYLDDLVTKKGKESLLAVVHADGNNMGIKIMKMLGTERDYDKAVKQMRKFTETTADCFETEGDKALKECSERLKNFYGKQRKPGKINESSFAYRRIVGSGDDMTFICNARFVMEYVKAYLDSVQQYQNNHDSKWNYSSCAGICIFHSHYPFAKAYRIAEQACDSAKKNVHSAEETKAMVEQGWIDFHFIHSGIGEDLEEIRIDQGTKDCIARPWLVSYSKDDETAKNATYKYEKLLKLNNIMKDTNVARTAIKTIGSLYEKSESAAKKELETLYGHTPNLKEKVASLYSDKDFLRALYDYAEIVDLWYGEVK